MVTVPVLSRPDVLMNRPRTLLREAGAGDEKRENQYEQALAYRDHGDTLEWSCRARFAQSKATAIRERRADIQKARPYLLRRRSCVCAVTRLHR